MKRIFTILIFLSLTITGFGQLLAPKGIIVGTGGTAKTLSVAELGYLDGTTSSIQGQLNNKTQIDYFITASNATAKETVIADAICDGTADQVQINAALALGYNVRLSSGQFNVSAPITSADSLVIITGAGKGKTLIYLSSGANSAVITIGANKWTIKDLSINGNDAGNTGTNINGISGTNVSNVVIDNCEITNQEDRAIFIYTPAGSAHVSKNWNIKNCYIHDSGGGITGDGENSNIKITDCIFSNINNTSSNSYIVVQKGTGGIPYDWVVDKCSFTGYTGYLGVYFIDARNTSVVNSYFDMDSCMGSGNPSCVRYTKSSGGVIDGNQFISSGFDGETGVHLWGSNNISISNNYFTDTKGGAGGVGLEAYSYSGYNIYNINIIGNTFYDVGHNLANDYGISMNAQSTYTISKVSITGNTFLDDRGATAKGIYAIGTIAPTSLGDVKDITISGNIIEGYLTGGILLSGSSDNVIISNNTITDEPIGILATDGNDIIVTGNKFTTNTTPIDINAANVTRTFIEGNNWYGSTNDPAYGATVTPRWGTNVGKDGTSFVAVAAVPEYKNYFSFHIMNGNQADTTAISDSTIIGSFYNTGTNTIVIDTVRAIMKHGQGLDTLGFNIVWGKDFLDGPTRKLVNTQLNCGRTGTSVYTNLTTGNFFTAFDNPFIPPGVTVYGTIPYKPADALKRKPRYFEVSAIGHIRGTTVTDYDGNIYTTVTLGTQTWLQQNLKVIHYRNGDAITNITDNTAWAALTTEAYCWYNNDITYKTPYGALYNWWAVTDARGLCPTGWHVPIATELATLATNAGANPGIHLKEDGTLHWTIDNADNSLGFNLIGAGQRNASDGTFVFTKVKNDIWTSEGGYPNGYYREVINSAATFDQSAWRRYSGYSVRCLKD